MEDITVPVWERLEPHEFQCRVRAKLPLVTSLSQNAWPACSAWPNKFSSSQIGEAKVTVQFKQGDGHFSGVRLDLALTSCVSLFLVFFCCPLIFGPVYVK